MLRRDFLALGLGAASTLTLAACSSSSSSSDTTETESGPVEEGDDSGETASGEKVFRYSVNTEPTTLDSTKGNSVADNEIMVYIQEGLVRNNCGTIQPGLAESWDVSDDGCTYTFHLREAYWPDGQQITSQDFLYAFRRLGDPETASPYAWILDGHIKNGGAVVNGEVAPEELGVSAPDDSTFVVELEYAQNYMLSLMGSCCQFTPVREDIVEEYGTDYAADASKMMTYGPFTLTSSANLVYIMEKNPDYWDADSINLDRLEMNYVSEAATALAMYEQGDLDYCAIPTEQVENYPDSPEYMAGSLDWVYINHESEYLTSQNLCLALNYALDRNTYNSLANGGVYAAWANPVMPDVDGVNDTYGNEVQPESYPLDGDTSTALEYLDAAIEELGVSSAADITLELVITDSESEKKAAEVLQELWQNSLGIVIDIRQVTYSEKYGNVCPDGDFQLCFAGWNPDYSDPWTYLELFMTSNVYNYSRFSADEFDELMESAKSISDATERLETLAQAEQVLIDSGAVVPLQVRTNHYILDDDISGVGFYFSGYNLYAVYADCDPT